MNDNKIRFDYADDRVAMSILFNPDAEIIERIQTSIKTARFEAAAVISTTTAVIHIDDKHTKYKIVAETDADEGFIQKFDKLDDEFPAILAAVKLSNLSEADKIHITSHYLKLIDEFLQDVIGGIWEYYSFLDATEGEW